jgi:hypothetical protein
MTEGVEDAILPLDAPAKHGSGGWQILWFLGHLAVVYGTVEFCTPWLAGWTRARLLPLLQSPTSLNPFEFLCSHIFVLSFLPAFAFGLAAYKFGHRAALFVWLPPTIISCLQASNFSAGVDLRESILRSVPLLL